VASVERTTPSRHLSPSLASSCRSFCCSRACTWPEPRRPGTEGIQEKETERGGELKEGEEGGSGDNNGKGAVTFDCSVLYMMHLSDAFVIPGILFLPTALLSPSRRVVLHYRE